MTPAEINLLCRCFENGRLFHDLKNGTLIEVDAMTTQGIPLFGPGVAVACLKTEPQVQLYLAVTELDEFVWTKNEGAYVEGAWRVRQDART